MELSLRLNYAKYQKQQELQNNDALPLSIDESAYYFINPPLAWFCIFDCCTQNESDLIDEINLLCNEIVNAIQDEKLLQNVECLRHFRKNMLKTDVLHKALMKEQNEFGNALSDRLEQGRNGNLNGQYPYNAIDELTISQANKTNVPLHRHRIYGDAQDWLAWNNQTVSPASLQPHRYYAQYPLNDHCFEDVDDAAFVPPKETTISPTSPLEIAMQNEEKQRDVYSEHGHDEEKSNAISDRSIEIDKNRKRKRSENASDNEKELSTIKKRKIIREKSK